ncbi:hypothetical protein D2V07_15165 [Aurantiacibacter zhengii]|uniref:Uncharacterized protein n=1 Tax=Aurantiacibacter zhengii TaxID=2307003 RepID=A0A418NPE1_9SPHN|nr:hypothetical protein D2V07_15165 [Aurantiacibacter zhengii]
MYEDEALAAMIERLTELDRVHSLNDQGGAPVTLQQDSVGCLPRIDSLQQQPMAQAEERRRVMQRPRIRSAHVGCARVEVAGA